jgi:predicted amidohydrolase
MQNLTLSYLQIDLVWEGAQANREAIEAEVLALDSCDIVVLPEMFLTGFTMSPETCAESIDGDNLQWLIGLAARSVKALAGSLSVSVAGEYRNRFLFITPEGKVAKYDKRHLFTMGDEPNHYTAGEERVIIHYKGWRIMPLVCYDLRFPAWSRNCDEYDLLIYVANWPAARRAAWHSLLQARAIENLAYVVGVNRVGLDGNGLEYAGDSQVISFDGEILKDTEPFKASIDSVTISKDDLNLYRSRFPAAADRDAFVLSGVKRRVVEL